MKFLADQTPYQTSKLAEMERGRDDMGRNGNSYYGLSSLWLLFEFALKLLCPQ